MASVADHWEADLGNCAINWDETSFLIHFCVYRSFSFFIMTVLIIHIVLTLFFGPFIFFWGIFFLLEYQVLDIKFYLYLLFSFEASFAKCNHYYAQWNGMATLFLFAFISPTNLLLSMRIKSILAIPPFTTFPILSYGTDSKTRYFLLECFYLAKIDS